MTQSQPSATVPEFTGRKAAFTPDRDYASWLGQLKQRFQQAQIKSAIRVNRGMLEFYWGLGRDIVRLKAEQKWGTGVLERLSLDLRELFPNQKGFSVTQLKAMKRWYLFYTQSDTIRPQVGAELEMPKSFALVPWKHHVLIICKAKSLEEALFPYHWPTGVSVNEQNPC